MATRSPIPDRAPPISNGLVQRTSIRLARILKGITIEPAVFILAFASSIDNIAVSQMGEYPLITNHSGKTASIHAVCFIRNRCKKHS